jgi:hypothetical protein
MEGKDEPKHLRGLIYNTFFHIFEHIEQMSSEMEFLVRVSMMEIYNEELRDLIGKESKQKLELKEQKDKGVYVKGLTSYVVKDATQIDNVLQTGKKNRTVGATLMNAESSRSHSIFMITIETSEKSVVDGENHIKVGKMNLVDLAGSERANKTGASGARLLEGCKINLSLSALGNVISALVEGKGGHVPYRDSKLTRLLQDSLGGNTKTVMVANISPADFNYEETLSTLRYASRAKKIQNKPKINEDPKDAMLKAFQEEIKKLKSQMQEMTGIGMVMPAQSTEAMPQSIQYIAGPHDVNSQPVANQSATIIQQTIVSTVNEEKLKEMMKLQEEEKQQMLEDMKNKSAESEEKLSQIVRQQEEEKNLLLEIIKQKTDDERKVLEQQFIEKQRELEEEKIRMEEELNKHNEALARHNEALDLERKRQEQLQKEKEEMAHKLEEMQAHVVRGKSLEKLEETNKRQLEKMRKQKEELERRKEEEERIKKELQDKADQKIELEQQYASIQDEVEVKTKKLKKVWGKFQSAKSEITDLQKEFQQEREDYLYTIRQLERDLKLRTKIIENFVPQEEVNKVTNRAAWDEEDDDWKIAHLNLSGNNAKMRPMSSRGKQNGLSSSMNGSISQRIKQDNVVPLELEMPERTTQDFDVGFEDVTSPKRSSSPALLLA